MKNAAIVAGLAAGASAFSLRPRDTATVLTDFQNITTQVKNLTANLNAINSDSTDTQLYALIDAVQNLDDAISKGISDAEATSPVGEADGCSVLEAVLALIPNVYDSLNAATNKAPIFANYPGLGDISGVVQGDFSTLSSLTNQFATALIAVAPAVDDAAATAAVDCINSGFVSAFATELATPSCTTAINLPCSGSSSASATSSAPVITSSASTGSSPSSSVVYETTCDETTASSTSAPYTSYPVSSSPVSSSAPVYTSYPVSSSPESTTSTIYSTYVSTIYECASTVTDCPYRTTSYSVAVSTTVCPVTSASYAAGGSGSSASYSAGGSGSSASYAAGGSGSSASYPAGGSGSSASYPAGGAGGSYPTGGAAGSTGGYPASTPSGYPAYTGAASTLERSSILGGIFAVVAFFL